MTSDDPLVRSWGTRYRLSEHLRLAVAHAVHAGHQPGDPPPLDEGDPVPGCACADCTGTGAPAPGPDRGGSADPGRDSDPLPVQEARRVPILEVARRLGCGEPEGKWGEPRVLCPLHDDTDPSLRLDTDRGLFYCDPCGEGGDGIALVMDARRCSFPDAVRWIADGRTAGSQDPAQGQLGGTA